MDPLSALGIAATVVTFVDFASSLISKAKEIHRSDDGSSAVNLQLETVYSRLLDISTRLQSQPQGLQSLPIEVSPLPQSEVLALKDLAAVCQADCKVLLNTLQRIRPGGERSRLWNSARSAFRDVLGRTEISAISARLQHTQNVISVHIGSILMHQIGVLQDSVNDLHRFNRSLSFNAGRTRTESLQQAIKELTSELNPPEDSISVAQLELWRKNLLDLLSARRGLTRDQAILASLNFESRTVRHCSIPKAYQETFAWAFEGEFGQWLKNGVGPFWISGKPGSGKSTLMKFLADHPKTAEMLADWAQPARPTIAAHYFWNPGTSLQKSQKGLLQTLLYDLFRNCPSAMISVSESRWRLAESSPWEAEQEPWTVEELSTTLQGVARMGDLPSRMCVFVDGMDEFEGDKLELCEALKSLSESTYIKLCVSSRPWNVFENNFGTEASRKLYIHNLTRGDILGFATGQLQSHPLWIASAIEDSEKQRFIDEICERANGVFLWVHLVTRSLRDGLMNYDTINELQRRLDSLPTDLERLFEHILNQRDPVYHEASSECLLIGLHAGSLPLRVHCYHDTELTDRGYWRNWPIGQQDSDQGLQLRIRSKLNARTGGLMEVSGQGSVDFLHRTVRDFLDTDEIRSRLGRETRPDFDAPPSPAKAYVVLLKSCPEKSIVSHKSLRPNFDAGAVCKLLRQALQQLSEVDMRHLSEGGDILDELERTTITMAGTPRLQLREGVDSPTFLFRALLLQYNLAWYLDQKLAEWAGYLSQFRSARHKPLYVALLADKPSVQTLDVLLRHGEVIQPSSGMSPWKLFCKRSPWGPGRGEYDDTKYTDYPNMVRVLKLFLQANSNPSGLVLGGTFDQFFETLRFRTAYSSASDPFTGTASEKLRFDCLLGMLDCFLESGGVEVSPKQILKIRGRPGDAISKEEFAILRRVALKTPAGEPLRRLRDEMQNCFPGTSSYGQQLLGMIETRLARVG